MHGELGRSDRLSIRVVSSEVSDWDGLHALLVDSFAFMDGRIDPPTSLARMTPATLAAKAQTETLIVAEIDGRLVGCGFAAEAGAALCLGKLAVAETARRQGILRAMIGLAEELARRSGKSWLELQTRIELTETHAAFAALGFVKVGETSHPGYDRPTSVTMRKAVAHG